MAKIIGVCGPQGSGKTTLLESLKGQVKDVLVDDFKVSRHVQNELGTTSLLTNVQSSFKDMIQFQLKIATTKFKHDDELLKRNDADIILVERTFIDVLTYTTIWTHELIKKNILIGTSELLKDITNLTLLCIDGHARYSGIVYLPFMSHIQWQTDNKRAPQHNINDFEVISSDLKKGLFSDVKFDNIKFHTVESETVIDRTTEVVNFINSLK